jgi:hypothetical protein
MSDIVALNPVETEQGHATQGFVYLFETIGELNGRSSEFPEVQRRGILADP